MLKAASRRAEALGPGDRAELESLLHPQFVWTPYTGEQFDRRSYLDANTGARTRWHGQRLADADVRFVGEVAVLRCTVTDDVTTDAARGMFRMPMTTTWVGGPDGVALPGRPRRERSSYTPIIERSSKPHRRAEFASPLRGSASRNRPGSNETATAH